MKTLYGIGEFSQITGLSVKALRFYHEKGILVPTSTDPATGYRMYDAGKIDRARVVMRLRQMEFSIEDISTVFAECGDDADILNHLERQKQLLQQRIAISFARFRKSLQKKRKRNGYWTTPRTRWRKNHSDRCWLPAFA